ncbi:flagellar biosynthesis protein FlhF [Achromobacter anxifer]
MKISRFFGANSRDVMRQVRQVLGPDALIVSNRSVDGGVEVLATVEGAFDDAAHEAAPRQEAAYSRQPEARQQVPAGSPAVPRFDAPDQGARAPAPVMPQGGYPAPSRSIAAYQTAYASSTQAEDETPEAQQPVASAPVAPVRVELPSLPPLRQMPAAGPAATPAGAATVAPQAYAAVATAGTAPVAPPAYPAAPAGTAQATPSAYSASPSTPAPAAPMPAARAPEALQSAPAPSMARMPDAPLRQPPAAPPAAMAADAAAGLQDAISALRGALESRMDGLLWGGRRGPGREPAGAALFRSLLDVGFSTKLVRTLVERLPEGMTPETALSWARNELVTHLPVLRSEDEFLAGGVYALVGPTGVGKTTTLAKLAARCVAREGREQVAMLTTDNFRIGALEQLQIYGRLMGVPAHSVRDAGELRRILAELGNRKIVLIDTTGISQRDRLVAEQAAMLCNAGKPVRRLLVLNAASQGDTLDEVAHAYRNGVGEDVAGCIITKLDEATRLGAALDTAIRHRLPIHYMSVGQKVPEHMELARADVLIDRAFSMVERARALYTPSEADLATLVSASRESESVDPARKRQLLASAILRPQGGAGSVEAAQNLDDAIAWLESDRACVQARTSWRGYVDDASGSSLAPLADEPLSMARREFSAVCGRHLLAVHGKAAMKGEGLPGGTLLGTLLMSDRGTALAAPAQQLVLPHGMLSSFAPAAPTQPDAALALQARVDWLTEKLARVPVVHMLETGTSALWPALNEQGVAWVARSAGGQRVIQDDCPTNLNAVGKSVGYLPVGQPGDMPGLHSIQAGKRVPLALWASGTEVTLSGRGAGDPVRLVCARLIDTVSGEVAGQLFGMTNLPASQADAATVARWLVLQDEAKAGFRYMVNAWQALPAVDGAHALARQALMAGQMGVACWQLAHTLGAEILQGPLSGIMGTERKLSGRMLPVALLKMYAMLEMTGG